MKVKLWYEYRKIEQYGIFYVSQIIDEIMYCLNVDWLKLCTEKSRKITKCLYEMI